MQWQHREPHYAGNENGGLVVVECPPGGPRQAAMNGWLLQANAAGADTWRLSCTPEAGGIWAGLADLVEALIPRIHEAAPDLVADHGYELSLVLPRYRDHIDVARPLTDTATPGERTRNYPADRAYRSLHGLIDLVSEWHARSGGVPWAIACDDFDRANGLVRRFFHELLRRRGRQLHLHLLVAVAPGQGDEVAAGFASSTVTARFRPEAPGRPDQPAVVAGPEEMARRAAALEARMEGDPFRPEVDLPRLIHYWQHSSQPERALRWRVEAVHAFNHFGLYEASLEHAEVIEAHLDRIGAADSFQYFQAVNGLFFCWVPLGQAERARQALETAFGHLDRTALPRAYYLAAMLHARFLKPNDLTKAEEYLELALALVTGDGAVDLPDDDRHFLTVFLMNGLALVRVRQRRSGDALALCQAGLDHLRQHLDPDQHRLHRSVLLYNIAQVYAQTGPDETAIYYFGQTMELDPNYSEYYNDRGAVFLKMGRLEEAEQDFRVAIGLSPPYAEVWVNLGQCCRASGQMSEAVAAYSRALDLEPGSALAWAGRADAHASLGWSEDALRDYDQALDLDPAQALVWAGRAIVNYEHGHVDLALSDLDRAVALAPDLGELRQNRAVALRDLGREAEAAADLRAYLELCPRADDRTDVEHQLESMVVAAAT